MAFQLMSRGLVGPLVTVCRNAAGSSAIAYGCAIQFHSRAVSTLETPISQNDVPAQSIQVFKPIGHPWHIVTAICVQRFPKLVQQKSPLELEFRSLQNQIKFERSRLSDHELEEIMHLRKKRAREKKALEEDVDVSQLEEDTEFEEIQEARAAYRQSFQPAPRATEADSDYKSVYRKLSDMLYFIVKNPREQWQMPQGPLSEGENLTQGAIRELGKKCGVNMNVQFLSNSPSLFLCSKYSSPIETHPCIVGSKVFFLKAQYKDGPVEINMEEVVDYAWVTKPEMANFVSQDYYKSVSQILLS